MNNVLPVLRRLPRETLYVLVQFPLAIASFVILVTGLAVAAGTMILVIGLPLLVVVLAAARLLAVSQRELVALRGSGHIEGGTYRRSTADTWWRLALDTVRAPQPWLDVLHGLVNFPLAIGTFVVTVTMWSMVGGGLTFWFWERWLPDRNGADNETLPELLDWSISESLLYLLIGIAAALLLPFAIRACASLHEGLARLLLDNSRVRDLEQQLRQEGAARQAAGQAEVDALRRLERDLHDGPQQRLVRLGMDLAVAERRLDAEPDRARELLAEARQQAADTLTELRALSRGIAPPILADRGLEAALVALAGRSPIPTTVAVELPASLVPPAAVETALYFVVSEAVANAAKHGGATSAAVTVGAVDSSIVVEVVDDGEGGAVPIPDHGLQGLADRMAAVSGTFDVTSPVGGPTRVVATAPCGS